MSVHLKRINLCIGVLLSLLLFAACDSPTSQTAPPTPTPTKPAAPAQAQQLLQQAGQKLTTAQTLHAIFNIKIDGETSNGTIGTEVWNNAPNQSRTVILNSTTPQFTKGAITVSDGKQIWQYDPAKKVVYNGPVSADNNGTGSLFGNSQNGQGQLIQTLAQTIFMSSQATQTPGTSTVDNHQVYTLHVTPQNANASQGNGTTVAYDGNVYLDTTTNLPVKVDINLQGFAQLTLSIPTLELNKTLAPTLFTFTPPPGTKVLPLSAAAPTPTTGTVTLAQAQQQAGYHLLSIPASQSDYQLEGVDILGAPGSQIFTLHYIKGNQSFSVVESKTLANLPMQGESVTVNGTPATFSNADNNPTLGWTSHGVGIRISGDLTKADAVAIAQLLA